MIADEYRRRRDGRRAEAERAEARAARISTARVIAFLAIIGDGWLAATHRAPGVTVALPALAFIVLVAWHDRAFAARERARRATRYWDAGLARIEERWTGEGPDGARFADEHHPYARDLDLFGRGSLFQLLCAARTRAGEETLARWLLHPADAGEARARQAAVAELRDRLELREALALAGDDVRAEVDPARLSSWSAAPVRLTSAAAWLLVAAVSLASATIIGGWLDLKWGLVPVSGALFVVAVVMRIFKEPVGEVHAGVDRPGRDLLVLALVLQLFEREKFSSARLMALQSGLASAGEPASRRIARLSRLVDWANAQRNQFFAPIGWLLLWPIHFAFAIERWRARSGADVQRWLASIGELETLSSLAGYACEHPGDPFPTILDGEPRLDAIALGHPLLPAKSCVRNDLSLGGGGGGGAGGDTRVLVVSGSNMSGKSTMLRTTGINVVLALAGAPARAEKLSLTPLQVGATLRIQDSLAEGASRFYAEITRLKLLVDLSRAAMPLLFLLDEVLAGTNSHDRRIGAEAVVRGLVERGALGLVTTHDLALAEMAATLGGRARNVHFEDRIVDGKLEFDYRMREGVVQHSNAIALMRAVGLDV
jgi:hypothetical protein